MSQHLFCYPVGCTGCPPQSINGARACHHHVCPRGVWRSRSKCIFVLFFFLTAFFPVKLLFSWQLILLFFIFVPPLYLNFTMSYVPIKICLPKLTFRFLISDINYTSNYLKMAYSRNITDYCSNITGILLITAVILLEYYWLLQ